MCKEFRRIEFSHVKRMGNRPAHLLANYAIGIDDFHVWMEENSCFLEQALSRDVCSGAFFGCPAMCGPLEG